MLTNERKSAISPNQQFILTLVALLCAATPGLFAYLSSQQVRHEVKEVHTIVNSRTDELQRRLDRALVVIEELKLHAAYRQGEER